MCKRLFFGQNLGNRSSKQKKNTRVIVSLNGQFKQNGSFKCKMSNVRFPNWYGTWYFVANHFLKSPLKNTEKLNSIKVKTLTPWNGHLKGFLDPLNGPRGSPQRSLGDSDKKIPNLKFAMAASGTSYRECSSY